MTLSPKTEMMLEDIEKLVKLLRDNDGIISDESLTKISDYDLADLLTITAILPSSVKEIYVFILGYIKKAGRIEAVVNQHEALHRDTVERARL